jgi:hypothetical protein
MDVCSPSEKLTTTLLFIMQKKLAQFSFDERE